MSDEIVSERRGAVLVVRINRPEAMNSINLAVMEGLSAAMEAAEDDPETRAVVLTGTGPRAFCAGLDLRAFREGELARRDASTTATFSRLMQGTVRVPIVAAVNAKAVGAGFQMLLGCDLVVASSAVELGLPEVKRGLFPSGAGTVLGTRVPLPIALEMVLIGDNISAERAVALGLVNALADPDRVLDLAIEYAERIAANGPLAVAAAKEVVRIGVSDAARAAERMRELLPGVLYSEDAKEGAAAFIERRAPVWRGR
jgi:enoyl-CoA hydratase